MTTPAEYRALAARVMAGEATNDLHVEIALAVGWTLDGAPYDRFWIPPGGSKSDWQIGPPRLLTSLDAAAALFAPFEARGWLLDIRHSLAKGWDRTGKLEWRVSAHNWKNGLAVRRVNTITEVLARVAMALLCLAAEGEASNV